MGTTMEWLTLLALVAGPVLAVFVTRYIDDRKERIRRRHEVFRDLMRTRSAKISLEHVTALNLVEFEFYSDKEVRLAWKNYMDTLSADFPADPAKQEGVLAKRNQLFIKLLQNIANHIGFKKIDVTDLMSLNYYPQGWVNDEDEQRQLRGLLVQTFSGLRPIQVKVNDSTKWSGPYPPFTMPEGPAEVPPLSLSAPKDKRKALR